MFRKKLVALSMAAALCFAVPAASIVASAEAVTTTDTAVSAATPVTFTSQDGVLSINLPNENWKQVEDPTKWIALSDGDNIITIE